MSRSTSLALGVLCAGLMQIVGAVSVEGQAPPVPQLRLDLVSDAIPTPPAASSIEWPLPRWQNGLLVYRREENTTNALPNIYAYDRRGQLAMSHTVWLKGAARILLRGYAVAANGQVAVAGVAFGDFGRKNFVREIQTSGAELRTIDLGAYFGSCVAYDFDGNLWVAGSAPADDLRYSREAGVLRRYRSGELQGEYLPYLTFLPRYDVSDALKIHPAEHTNHGMAFLLPLAGHGVGLWSDATREWIEVASDGSVLSRIQVVADPIAEAPGRVNLTGLAVTTSGDVLASFTLPTGPAMYVLDRTALKWSPVSVKDDDQNALYYLAGSDGDSVVYQTLTRTTMNVAKLNRLATE